MPKSAIASDAAVLAPPARPPLPFLLSVHQGVAARALLSYVAALPLASPDAQLLAVVVAIRAARGGIGNITGTDLRALRLTDAPEAVAALRGLGWQVSDALVDGPPDIPVPITVPGLAPDVDHPLRFAKARRSRVSGWVMRTLTAKPVRKTPPELRLAALFLAAHSSPELLGELPPDLPGTCRGAVSELALKGFLADLAGDRYRLDPAVRHLSGVVMPPVDQEQPPPPTASASKRREISAEEWARWKAGTTPALRRHVDTVERCPLCEFPGDQVRTAFMIHGEPSAVSARLLEKHEAWKAAHPDRGPLAARFTVAFRAEHGHGPSYNQLCGGLGWKFSRRLRGIVVGAILDDGWLTDTSPVPWTLRPGKTGQAHGIFLPRQTPVAGR
ncbi:hypothetical protein [Streptomyces sp. 8L]|uniref:hypothetical protein n=1 Tax=Streptomyces sp. 8L TaxID=2877242 RepID=UPI001CD7295E|nr:hypothetical protein [Streptomyces sp. 8L]MCA1222381.1 hypothetical protein [Streptomyces sp. 8L]